MQLTLKYSLPFVTATLVYHRTKIKVPHILVDTGSARTMFASCRSSFPTQKRDNAL